jgi:hypothetical protein
MADAEITPTPYTADSPFWTSPDAVHADDLDTAKPQGDPYAGIPDFEGALFTTHADCPPDSVPQAMAPSDAWLPVREGATFPAKDND